VVATGWHGWKGRWEAAQLLSRYRVMIQKGGGGGINGVEDEALAFSWGNAHPPRVNAMGRYKTEQCVLHALRSTISQMNIFKTVSAAAVTTDTNAMFCFSIRRVCAQ